MFPQAFARFTVTRVTAQKARAQKTLHVIDIDIVVVARLCF
jgi:hypothetical protein